MARAFSAHEMNLSILESTEEQNKILKEDYCKKLADLKLKDPKQHKATRKFGGKNLQICQNVFP